jgi:hypothetical protein
MLKKKHTLKDIHKLIAQAIPVTEEHPFKMVSNGFAPTRSTQQRSQSYRPAKQAFQ